MIETQIVTKVGCDKCGVVEEFKANDLPGEVYVWEIEEQCLTDLEITNWVCADDATQKCPKCADRVEFEETDHRRRLNGYTIT